MTEYIEREQALSALCNNSIPVSDGDGHTSFVGDYIAALNSVPAADVVKVIRCKDCGFWYVPKLEKGEKLGACGWWSGNAYIRATRAEDYCSRSVRKEG